MIRSVLLGRVDNLEIHRLAEQLIHVPSIDDRVWVDFSNQHQGGRYVALAIWNRYGEIDLIGLHSKSILCDELLWFSILPVNPAKEVFRMDHFWYQIDRRQSDGTLDRYDMVKAKSFDDALREYLGDDYPDYDISRSRINGRDVITARCPKETSGYLEISRAVQGG